MSKLKSLFAAARKETVRSGRRSVRQKKAPVLLTKVAPKGIIKWLREKRVNTFFPPHPSIQAAYALEKGWVFNLPGGDGLVLTKQGMQAAWPWAVDFLWRSDRGIWEGLCGHGVGHPVHTDPEDRTAGIHGCDGCCYDKETK